MPEITGGGHADDLGRLFQENSAWLLGFFMRRLKSNRADAEDCVQETFIRYLKRSGWEEIKDVRPYLLQIARSVFIDLLRRRRTRKEISLRRRARTKDGSDGDEVQHRQMLEAVEDRRMESNPERVAASDEYFGIVRKVIEQDYAAPEMRRERRLILMHLAGMTNKEIAARLEENPDTIKSDVAKARANFKYRLRRYLGTHLRPRKDAA